jgi:hypothetical protein
MTPGDQSIWDHTFDTTNWIIHDVNPTSTSNLQNFLLPTALCIVDDKVCTSLRTCDIQLGRRGTRNHVRAERCADAGLGWSESRTGEIGNTPLPIWTAAIPTPPAAANTSSHSPVEQEVLRIFVNYGFAVSCAPAWSFARPTSAS